MYEERSAAGAGFAAALLRSHGIRPTPQRVWIAAHLLERPQHVSADRLFEVAQQQGRDVSRATVYNTLNLFLDRGLVRQVLVEPGRVFYDSNTSAHYHIYHEDTGVLTDFPVDAVRLAGLPPLPEGTEDAGVDVIVRVRDRRD